MNMIYLNHDLFHDSKQIWLLKIMPTNIQLAELKSVSIWSIGNLVLINVLNYTNTNQTNFEYVWDSVEEICHCLAHSNGCQ